MLYNCAICGENPIVDEWEGYCKPYDVIGCENCDIWIGNETTRYSEIEEMWNEQQFRFTEKIVERFAEPVMSDNNYNSKVVGWRLGRFGCPTKEQLIKTILLSY